jgi:hypothetical protein
MKEIRENTNQALRKAGFRPAPITEELLVSYLSKNSTSGVPLTPQSFLYYNLRGVAKSYSGKYYRAFIPRLAALYDAGLVELCRSARGGEAYRWKSQG